MYQDREHYRYQRRVPNAVRGIVGCAVWKIGLGADYVAAVAAAAQLASEHDDLIQALKDPHRGLDVVKDHTKAQASLPPTAHMLAEIASQHGGDVRMRVASPIRPGDTHIDLVPDIDDPGMLATIRRGIAVSDAASSDAARILILHRLLAGFFSDDAIAPDDPDDAEDWAALRRKIERRIEAISPDRDTITSVLERYIAHQRVTAEVAYRYRRFTKQFVEMIGEDVPVRRLTAMQLRAFRNHMMRGRSPATVKAAFVPIKGLLQYAIEEDIIESNPGRIRLPKEKLAVEDRMWLPFSPSEAKLVLEYAEEYWTGPKRTRYLDRCRAFLMVTRACAFTGCRPKEIVRLTPETVTDDAITIRGSKTASSSRIIPIHPEIAGLPDFVRSGGLRTFGDVSHQPTMPLRRNHATLLRERVGITDPRKSLYSWRSTFQNAMERAGVAKDVRQAILGHVEGGAIRHYSAGPDWQTKVDAVMRSDPRRD